MSNFLMPGDKIKKSVCEKDRRVKLLGFQRGLEMNAYKVLNILKSRFI